MYAIEKDGKYFSGMCSSGEYFTKSLSNAVSYDTELKAEHSAELMNFENFNIEPMLNVKTENKNWITGTFGRFEFEAKVFPNPSKTFGILRHGADGHISKLHVYDEESGDVLTYSRAWDVSNLPEDSEREIVQAIEDYTKNEFELG